MQKRCQNTHTHTPNDVECMFARVEGNSRSRKLDELLINHDYSWSAFWSLPQADDEMQIESCDAIKFHESVEKGCYSRDLQRRETR